MIPKDSFKNRQKINSHIYFWYSGNTVQALSVCSADWPEAEKAILTLSATYYNILGRKNVLYLSFVLFYNEIQVIDNITGLDFRQRCVSFCCLLDNLLDLEQNNLKNCLCFDGKSQGLLFQRQI